jgi:hypothetical protein
LRGVVREHIAARGTKPKLVDMDGSNAMNVAGSGNPYDDDEAELK